MTLFVGLSRGPAIEQAGISHEFRPGNGFLYHGAIPGGCEAASPFEVWGIKVESDRLRSGLVRGRGLKPMGIPAELPAMKLITQYLTSYSTVAGSLDPDVHEAFGTHLVDLLMLLVGADCDALELIKGRGLKAARTEAVLKTIERDFASRICPPSGPGSCSGSQRVRFTVCSMKRPRRSMSTFSSGALSNRPGC